MVLYRILKGILEDYRQALISGVLLDGATRIDDSNIDSPPSPESGFYLVALLCNEAGFHWLRREEKGRTWSWKDGNGDTVKYNIYELVTKKYVQICDGTEYNFSTLVTRNVDKTYVGWRYNNMRFVSFFKIPIKGLPVAGDSH